jgi:hypothetical protein
MECTWSSQCLDIITNIYVFDWKCWFLPWMREISNHSKWRAFRFYRNPTDENSVLMQWKENEYSNKPFHGTEEHPEGLELLLENPLGHPERLFPRPIDTTPLQEISTTFPVMIPAEQI